MLNLLFIGSRLPEPKDSDNIMILKPQNKGIKIESQAEIPHLVLLDMSRQDALPYLLAVRERFSKEICSVWGYGNSTNLVTENLFYAFGGNRRDTLEYLWQEIQRLDPEDRNLPEFHFPLVFSSHRESYLKHLSHRMKWQEAQHSFAELIHQKKSFTHTIESYFRWLEDIYHPHLIVLLLLDHLTVEAFVKPSKKIFMEDYKDFKNFCLNDFFQYFPGVDLENPHEQFFLDDRKDFTKLSMEKRKISSYLCVPLTNQNGRVIATLNLGHLDNHYFNESISASIRSLLEHLNNPFEFAFIINQQELRQQKIFNIFSRFVPLDIIPQLVEQESAKDYVRASKQDITVLFCDIRSFTTITESNSAQQVVEFLNRHFEAMVGAIEKEGGSIDKFIGDAIVAFFGVPRQLKNHAQSAMNAAIQMIRNLQEVETEGLKLPEGGYSIGVGLHSGEAIVGNIGSAEKSDYTAIGDVIGIAEELEAATKENSGHILASQSVIDLLDNSFPVKNVGTFEEHPIYIPIWEDTKGDL